MPALPSVLVRLEAAEQPGAATPPETEWAEARSLIDRVWEVAEVQAPTGRASAPVVVADWATTPRLEAEWERALRAEDVPAVVRAAAWLALAPSAFCPAWLRRVARARLAQPPWLFRGLTEAAEELLLEAAHWAVRQPAVVAALAAHSEAGFAAQLRHAVACEAARQRHLSPELWERVLTVCLLDTRTPTLARDARFEPEAVESGHQTP